MLLFLYRNQKNLVANEQLEGGVMEEEKRPNYRKMLKSWIIFALCAFLVLWITSFMGGPHYDSNGRLYYGYTLGLILISVALPLISIPFVTEEDETSTILISFVPAGLFALSWLKFAEQTRDSMSIGVVLAFFAIVMLCVSLMPFGDKKGKEKYPQRRDRVKAYALCTTLVVGFTGSSLLAIKYLF